MAGVPGGARAPDAGPLERDPHPLGLRRAGAARRRRHRPELPARRSRSCRSGRDDRSERAADTGVRVAQPGPRHDPLHQRDHGPAEGGDAERGGHRRRPRRPGPGVGVDAATTCWCTACPLFHVHGLVLGVLGALRIGSRLVHTGRPTPAAYAAAAADGGTLFFGVPTVWSRVAADARRPQAPCAPPVCWSPAAPGFPVPVFEQLAAWPVRGPSSGTG